MTLKQKLDQEVQNRNNSEELSLDKPDPLIIAKRYNDEWISLICALFAYGNAGQIVKFLSSLDFNLLNKSEEEIKEKLKEKYYRFQKSEDVIVFFIAIKRLKEQSSLEDIFFSAYNSKDNSVLEGIMSIIQALKDIYPYSSQGYNFLIGKEAKRDKEQNIKETGNSPYKRYNMFLRWMVRDDYLDMGL